MHLAQGLGDDSNAHLHSLKNHILSCVRAAPLPKILHRDLRTTRWHCPKPTPAVANTVSSPPSPLPRPHNPLHTLPSIPVGMRAMAKAAAIGLLIVLVAPTALSQGALPSFALAPRCFRCPSRAFDSGCSHSASCARKTQQKTRCSLSPHAADACVTCTCTGTVVDCRGLQLVTIPPNIPAGTTTL